MMTANEDSASRQPTLLLVDDEPHVTETLRVALRSRPYRILTASRAKQGLEILEEESVDVVVTDERMPEMSGSEFLRIVRERHPRVMRIVLTGQASMEATLAAINEAEVFRFLTKPVAAENLAEVIECALEAQAERARIEEAGRRGRPSADDEALFEAGMQGMWMAFQPLVAVHSRSTVAFEALLRSSHPEIRDAVHLLDLAQSLGRLSELELRINESIAQTARAAREETLFFVNIHPSALEEPHLFECDHPLCEIAERVVIEVTERAPLDSIPDVPGKIDALRARGYRIALDDLGAGYAGLTSFAQLQPEFVKFDMALVRDIHRCSTKSKLVASMISLCRELRIQTIGEGVETEEERNALVDLGCDILQGYLHGRPGKSFVEGLWDAAPER